jgi:hypothetical protein
MVRIRMFVALTAVALSSATALAEDAFHGTLQYESGGDAGEYWFSQKGLLIKYDAPFGPRERNPRENTRDITWYWVPKSEFENKLGDIQGHDLAILLNKLLSTSFDFTAWNADKTECLGKGSLQFTTYDGANDLHCALTSDGAVQTFVFKVGP